MEYKNEKELGPDSIQKWCEEMDKLEREQLTQKEAETHIMCTINQDKINKDPAFNSVLLGRWNAVSILHNRIQTYHTYTIDNAALLFLGSLIDRPGIAVQYTNFIQYKCWQRGIKRVTMDSISKVIMPWGKFKMEDLQIMWEKQKYIASDKKHGMLNMLDKMGCMFSIRDIVSK